MQVVDHEYNSNGGKGAWGGQSRYDPHYEEEHNYDRSQRGCWASFAGCIGGMWATRQMTKKEDREIYVRTTLRELVVYIIFLIVLCVLTFGMASASMYYYTRVLSDLFLDTPYPKTRNTLRGSTQVMDFWRFAENTMLDGLYWEFMYDIGLSPILPEDRNVLYENRLLGVPRLRQLRVRNDSCVVPDDFKRAIIKCYSPYSYDAEEKESFGDDENVWHYHTEEELKGSRYSGKLTRYSGAGYYVDLASNRNESEAIVDKLREKLWIDRSTRVVFLDFTVYNANINLFCVVKIVVEFPATGGIIPSWSFRTIKLLRYVTVTDHIVLACEIMFALFICYYIVEEVLEIATIRCQYFHSLWNILDLVVIGISCVCIAFNVINTLTIGDRLEELLRDEESFPDFESIGFWQVQFNALVAICVFCAWFKLFKYISFNKTMTQLFSTLSRASTDVAGFAIIFFIVFFAFAQLGYLLFGTQVRDFSSFLNAIFTLLRTILGDFNFNEIQQANRVLGPIYFLSYVFFVFFVLLNMFLAIINDTYSEVKTEISNQKSEFELADYFKRGYNNMLGKMGRRNKLIDIENALKLSATNHNSELSFEEVRRNLKKCNFSDLEIEMIFAKYDVNGDRYLEEDEIKRMLTDISGGGSNSLENQVTKPPAARPVSARSVKSRPDTGVSGGVSGISTEEFMVMTNRVDNIEESIGRIVTRIDVLLYKLDVMEKSKTKKKEFMGKKLEDLFDGH